MISPYYTSLEWHRLKNAVRRRAGLKCEINEPGCAGLMQTAHHKSYANFGKADEAELNDVVAACWNCHSAQHPDKPEIRSRVYLAEKHPNYVDPATLPVSTSDPDYPVSTSDPDYPMSMADPDYPMGSAE